MINNFLENLLLDGAVLQYFCIILYTIQVGTLKLILFLRNIIFLNVLVDFLRVLMFSSSNIRVHSLQYNIGKYVYRKWLVLLI